MHADNVYICLQSPCLVLEVYAYLLPCLHLGDYVDKRELSIAVRDVLRSLACRAIQPSPLTPALTLHELERLLSLLGQQTLSSIAEGECRVSEFILPFFYETCVT